MKKPPTDLFFMNKKHLQTMIVLHFMNHAASRLPPFRINPATRPLWPLTSWKSGKGYQILPVFRKNGSFWHLFLKVGQFYAHPMINGTWQAQTSEVRIINGRPPEHPIPWMVLLTIKKKLGDGESHCTGFILNSWFIMTAAHCLCDVSHFLELHWLFSGVHNLFTCFTT